MFLGHYLHSIDEKNRLTIPVRYRELMPDGGYLTLGFDGNLMVLPPAVYDIISTRIGQMSITDPNARYLKRMFFSNTWNVEVDKLGRILIPQDLRAAAKLENTAVVNGVKQYFEIWSPELWAEHMALQFDPEYRDRAISAMDLPLI